MLTIARLFGKSPFAPLQSHMEKVRICVEKLSEVFETFHSLDEENLKSAVYEVSKLEHEADLTKNDIRNHLPKSLFLPIDRHQLLEILSIQDRLADKAEEIGNLLTLYPLNVSSQLFEGLHTLFKKNLEAFQDTVRIVLEIGALLETSFGGIEAEKVKTMVEQTSFKEYEADKIKHELMRQFFAQAESLNTPTFYLYLRLVEEINQIAHTSELLANRIRMILELK